MPSSAPITNIRVQKVSYIHDPKAQQTWTEILAQVFKEEIDKDLNTRMLDKPDGEDAS